MRKLFVTIAVLAAAYYLLRPRKPRLKPAPKPLGIAPPESDPVKALALIKKRETKAVDDLSAPGSITPGLGLTKDMTLNLGQPTEVYESKVMIK